MSRFPAVIALALLSACSDKDPASPPSSNGGIDTTTVTTGGSTTGRTLSSLGLGAVNDRYTAEVWVRGATAYTTTWGLRGSARGNAVKIWNVAGASPVLVDSLLVSGATTLGDIQTSDDGKLLVVAIEQSPNGGLAIYDATDPRKPTLVTRTTGGDLANGVHTAEVARVNGKLYAFASLDPTGSAAARLAIVDLTTPASPRTVSTLVIGAPYIHDVFVRDGYLFTAEWNDGVGIYDIGAVSGSPESPRLITHATTVGGQVHNVWWFHDPSSGAKKYLFVGQEGPGSIGSSSTGDVHVVDISNLTAPTEVAAFTVTGAGTHNFSVDEANGLLYAAYYNGGVRVVDIRGDLASCTAAQKFANGRCNLTLAGREKAQFTGDASRPLYIWGVHWQGNALYASDMLNGLWKVQASAR